MPVFKKRRVMKRKTTKRRRMTNIRGRNRLARTVRSLVLRNTETKYAFQTAEDLQLWHNAGLSVSTGVGATGYFALANLLGCSQGNTQTTRVGDSVFGKLLSIKIWLANKSDRPNVMYRIMLLSMPTDASTSFPTGFFRGEAGNKMIDSVNTDRYKILKSRMIKPGANDYSLEGSSTLREKSNFIKMTIGLGNREIRYNTDGGSAVSNQRDNLVLFIMGYDATGTLTTDKIASCTVTSKFYFKDP